MEILESIENFIEISKQELIEYLNNGLNISDIAKLYSQSFYKIKKLINKYKLKTTDHIQCCLNCHKNFLSNVSRPAKYCSPKCRTAHWPKLYPEKFKEHQKKSRLKCNPIKCKFCKNLIPDAKRKSGVVYCSDDCRKEKRKENNKSNRDKIIKEFAQYKLSIGCKICGYKNCAGSLDFHHIEKTSKLTRISAGLWKSNSELYKKEISKCILLCKNCHYEIHNCS